MTECRLLIVNDDKVFLDQLEMTIDREHKPYVEGKGIALSIEKAYSPADLKELDGETYDIILSDLCLTDEDEEDPGNSSAIQWLETIKGTEPIIILLSDYIDNDEIVQSIIERFTGIRIIPKNPVSLWNMQLFSALDQFQNYSIPIRYMDRNLVKLIRQLHGEEDLKRMHMAILFVDIRNFTKLCDYFQKNQDIIYQQMAKYFNGAEKTIHTNGGIIDKIMGDCIMVEFVDEITPQNYLKSALTATEELVRQFAQLKKNLNKKLLHEEKTEKEAEDIIEKLSLGCGIYAGNINFEKFGDKERKHFMAMGHEVNMAQRLESAARIENIPFKYRRGIQPDQEVAAIILLPDVVANELVIREEMKLYQQIPTTSENVILTHRHDENLYIRNYNSNKINRNAYCRIITKEWIDEQQRRKPKEMD